MSATSGGSGSEGSEAGESSRSTVSVTDLPPGSFSAGENVTKITLNMEEAAERSGDLSGSRVILTGIDECDRSVDGVVNMAFVGEDRGHSSEIDFKSINESDGKDKSAEAVNLELVNMVPYTNGNGTNYGIPVNGIPGIPVKKDVEQGEMGTPYDEYFVPVNEHKKFMRGEKLYVTKDKRRPPSWKKCLTWSIACLVITVVIILGILAGTGIILNQEPDLVKEASVGRNFGSGVDSKEGTEPTGKSSVTPPPSLTTDIFSPTTDLSFVRVPRSLESELVIDNMEYNPMLDQINSSAYQSFTADLEEKLKMALFDYQTLNYGASNIGLRIVNVSQSPMKVKFRVGWTFKQGIHNPPDPITLEEVESRLKTELKTSNGFLGPYHIDSSAIKVGNVMNLCLFDNGGCSHECSYDYGIKQQFVCSCPAPLVLDHTLKNCISLDDVPHGFANPGLGSEPSPEPSPEPEPSAEPEPSPDNDASAIPKSSSEVSPEHDRGETVKKDEADGLEHDEGERRIQSEFDGHHTATDPHKTSYQDADGSVEGVSKEHVTGHGMDNIQRTYSGKQDTSPVTAHDEASSPAVNHDGNDLPDGSRGDGGDVSSQKEEEGSTGRGFGYETVPPEGGSGNGTHGEMHHGSVVVMGGSEKSEHELGDGVWSEFATDGTTDQGMDHSTSSPHEAVISHHDWRYNAGTIQSSMESQEDDSALRPQANQSSSDPEGFRHGESNVSFHGFASHPSSADSDGSGDGMATMTPDQDVAGITQHPSIDLEDSKRTALGTSSDSSSHVHDSTMVTESPNDSESDVHAEMTGKHKGGDDESSGTSAGLDGSGHATTDERNLHGNATQVSSIRVESSADVKLSGGRNADESGMTTMSSTDLGAGTDDGENVLGSMKKAQSSPADLEGLKHLTAGTSTNHNANGEESARTASSSPASFEGSSTGENDGRNQNSFGVDQSAPTDMERFRDSSPSYGVEEESGGKNMSSATHLEGTGHSATEVGGGNSGNFHDSARRNQSSPTGGESTKDSPVTISQGDSANVEDSGTPLPSPTDLEGSRHMSEVEARDHGGKFGDERAPQSTSIDAEGVMHFGVAMTRDHKTEADQPSKPVKNSSADPDQDKTSKMVVDGHAYPPESNLNSEEGTTSANVHPDKKDIIRGSEAGTTEPNGVFMSNVEGNTEKTPGGTSKTSKANTYDGSGILGSSTHRKDENGSEPSRTHGGIISENETASKNTPRDEHSPGDLAAEHPEFVGDAVKHSESKKYNAEEKPVTERETTPKDGQWKITTHYPIGSEAGITPATFHNKEAAGEVGDSPPEDHGTTEEPERHTERTVEGEGALIPEDGTLASGLSPSVMTDAGVPRESPSSGDKPAKTLEHDVDNESFNTLLGDEYSKSVSKESLITKYKNKEKKKDKEDKTLKDLVHGGQDGGKDDESGAVEESVNSSSEEVNPAGVTFPDSKEMDSKLDKDHGKLDKDHKFEKQKVSKKKDAKKKPGSKDGKNFELDDRYVMELNGKTERKPAEERTLGPETLRTSTEREIRGYSVWEDVEETGPTLSPTAYRSTTESGGVVVKDGTAAVTEPEEDIVKFGSHPTGEGQKLDGETNEEEPEVKVHFGLHDSNFHNVSDDLEKDFPRDRIQVSGVRYPSFHIASGSDDSGEDGRSTNVELGNSSVRVYTDGDKKYFVTSVGNPELGGVNTTIRVYFNESGPNFDGNVKFLLPNGTQIFTDEKGNLMTALGDTDWLKHLTPFGYYNGKTIKNEPPVGDGTNVLHHESDGKVTDPAPLNKSFTEIPKWLMGNNNTKSSGGRQHDSAASGSAADGDDVHSATGPFHFNFTNGKHELRPFSRIVYYDRGGNVVDPAAAENNAKISRVVYYDADGKEVSPMKLGGSYSAGEQQVRFDEDGKGYVRRIVYHDADGNVVDPSKVNATSGDGQREQPGYIRRIVYYDTSGNVIDPATLGVQQSGNDNGGYTRRVVYHDADGNVVDPSKLNISSGSVHLQQAAKEPSQKIVYYDSNGNIVYPAMYNTFSSDGLPLFGNNTGGHAQRVLYHDAFGNADEPSKLNIYGNEGQPQQAFDGAGKSYTRRIVYYDVDGNVVDPSKYNISGSDGLQHQAFDNAGREYAQKTVYYDSSGKIVDLSKFNLSNGDGIALLGNNSRGYMQRVIYPEDDGNVVDRSKLNVSNSGGQLRQPDYDRRIVYSNIGGNAAGPAAFGTQQKFGNGGEQYAQKIVYYDTEGNVIEPSTLNRTANSEKGYIQKIIHFDADGREVDPNQRQGNGNGYRERLTHYDASGDAVHPATLNPERTAQNRGGNSNFTRIAYHGAHGDIVDPTTVNNSVADGLSKGSDGGGHTESHIYYDANGNVIGPAKVNGTKKAEDWKSGQSNIVYYDADGQIIDPTRVHPHLKDSPEWQLGNIGHRNISKVVYSDASGTVIDPSKLISSLVGRLSGWETNNTHPVGSVDSNEHAFNLTIAPDVVNGSSAFVNRVISASPTFAVGNSTFRIYSNRNGTNNLTTPDEEGKIFTSPEGHPSIKIGNSTVRIFSDENGKFFTSDGSPTFKVGNLTYRIYSKGNRTGGNSGEESGDLRRTDSATESGFRAEQFQNLSTAAPVETHTILVPVTNIVTGVLKTSVDNFTLDRGAAAAAGHDGNRTNFSKCAAGQFQCVNGTSRGGSACVSLSSKCDSINDCSDGSDELGCIENGCPGNFQCSDGTCLKRHLVCNGIVDCDDGSDEKSCENWKCEFDEFQCPSGRCIPVVWQCDNKPDCDNHTDEYNCQTSCGNDEFLCPEGWCVPLTYKCNGVKECTNGEDEQFCDCAVDEFKCESGGCVPTKQVCDGIEHCPDGSDERNCIRTDDLLEIRASDGAYLPVCSDGWTKQHSDEVCAALGYSSSVQTDMKSPPPETDKQFFSLQSDSTDVPDLINKGFLVNLVKSNETCNSGKYVEVTCQPFSCGSRSMTESGLAGRLAGGVNTVTGQWPSIALLYNTRNPHSCTANILTPRWALASYSCLKMGNKNIQEQDWKLYSGLTVFEPEMETAETRKVIRIVPHPQVKFNQFLYSNDVALVELSEPLNFGDSVGAVCLPEAEIQPRQICVTAGWGMETPGDGVMKQHLQYLPIPTMDLENCNSSDHYSGFITNDKICAGYTAPDKSLCYNEEGAPLMCVNDKGEWELHGVLSYHSNCGRGSHPSIFSSISSVRDWIQSTTGTRYERASALHR